MDYKRRLSCLDILSIIPDIRGIKSHIHDDSMIGHIKLSLSVGTIHIYHLFKQFQEYSFQSLYPNSVLKKSPVYVSN